MTSFTREIKRLPCPGQSVKCAPVHWYVAPTKTLPVELLEQVRFERLLENPRFQVIKHQEEILWGKWIEQGCCCFIKARLVLSQRRRIISIFNRSPLKEEWQKTWWVRRQGIATAEPLALGEMRRAFQLTENYIIYRWLENGQSLGPFLENLRQRQSVADYETFRSRVLNELGHVVGSLHARQAHHRQLHPLNITIVPPIAEQSLRIIPVDYKHLSIYRRMTESEWAWNIYQVSSQIRPPIMDWSRDSNDLRIFFKGYHKAEPNLASSYEALLEKINHILPLNPLSKRPNRS